MSRIRPAFRMFMSVLVAALIFITFSTGYTVATTGSLVFAPEVARLMLVMVGLLIVSTVGLLLTNSIPRIRRWRRQRRKNRRRQQRASAANSY